MWYRHTQPEELAEVLEEKLHINGEYKRVVNGRKLFILIRNGNIHCCRFIKEAIDRCRDEAYNHPEVPDEDERKPCPNCREEISRSEMDDGRICPFCDCVLIMHMTYEWITEEELREKIGKGIKEFWEDEDDKGMWDRRWGQEGISLKLEVRRDEGEEEEEEEGDNCC